MTERKRPLDIPTTIFVRRSVAVQIAAEFNSTINRHIDTVCDKLRTILEKVCILKYKIYLIYKQPFSAQ